jgi:hypothetical protein
LKAKRIGNSSPNIVTFVPGDENNDGGTWTVENLPILPGNKDISLLVEEHYHGDHDAGLDAFDGPQC